MSFDERVIVSALLIQGSGETNGSYIESFQMSYSSNGVYWNTYTSSLLETDAVSIGVTSCK